jgi:sugar diacid utilization regulator
MLAAVLAGEGLRGIAALAAEELGGPVAIVLPARGLADASSEAVTLGELTRFATERLAGAAPRAPAGVKLAQPVETGEGTMGFVLAMRASANGLPAPAVDREEVLRTAALAALTEVAVNDARDQVADEVRGTLLEELRSGRVTGDDVERRAVRLGCDLSRGAVALVSEMRSARPLHAAALIAGEHQGAITQTIDGRVYAILPAIGEPPSERTEASARALAARLRAHGPAAWSSFCEQPGDVGRAITEAELMLDVIIRDERLAEQLERGVGNGVYRLLFRALATHPEEVRQFYEDTVEPLVAHDRRYHTDLLGTVEAYLANDCNMNATARVLYAHRHTIAHRLGRVRELTGLDAAAGDDRERLGLGIKAYRLIAPTLPR